MLQLLRNGLISWRCSKFLAYLLISSSQPCSPTHLVGWTRPRTSPHVGRGGVRVFPLWMMSIDVYVQFDYDTRSGKALADPLPGSCIRINGGLCRPSLEDYRFQTEDYNRRRIYVYVHGPSIYNDLIDWLHQSLYTVVILWAMIWRPYCRAVGRKLYWIRDRTGPVLTEDSLR